MPRSSSTQSKAGSAGLRHGLLSLPPRCTSNTKSNTSNHATTKATTHLHQRRESSGPAQLQPHGVPKPPTPQGQESTTQASVAGQPLTSAQAPVPDRPPLRPHIFPEWIGSSPTHMMRTSGLRMLSCVNGWRRFVWTIHQQIEIGFWYAVDALLSMLPELVSL